MAVERLDVVMVLAGHDHYYHLDHGFPSQATPYHPATNAANVNRDAAGTIQAQPEITSSVQAAHDLDQRFPVHVHAPFIRPRARSPTAGTRAAAHSTHLPPHGSHRHAR